MRMTLALASIALAILVAVPAPGETFLPADLPPVQWERTPDDVIANLVAGEAVVWVGVIEDVRVEGQDGEVQIEYLCRHLLSPRLTYATVEMRPLPVSRSGNGRFLVSFRMSASLDDAHAANDQWRTTLSFIIVAGTVNKVIQRMSRSYVQLDNRRVVVAMDLVEYVDACQPSPTKERHYEVPGHGGLHLTLPQPWCEDVRRSAPDFPLVITLQPNAGNEFHVEVTAVPVPVEVRDPDVAAWVHRHMSSDLAEDSSSVEESAVQLSDLSGAHAAGYYYALTDKTAKPGEYKYLLVAAVKMGSLVVRVRALTNDPERKAFDSVLAMLRGGRLDDSR